MYSIIITDDIVEMFKIFRCEGRGLFLLFYKLLENYGRLTSASDVILRVVVHPEPTGQM